METIFGAIRHDVEFVRYKIIIQLIVRMRVYIGNSINQYFIVYFIQNVCKQKQCKNLYNKVNKVYNIQLPITEGPTYLFNGQIQLFFTFY